MEEGKTKTGEQAAIDASPATNGQVKKDITLSTAAVVLTIIATVFGGAKWLVTSTWAQGKEHADAGIAVLRAEFEAHKKEESSERERTRTDVQLLRLEQYDARKELKAFFEFQRTGSREAEAILKAPLPPPPVPTPSKDGGR